MSVVLNFHSNSLKRYNSKSLQNIILCCEMVSQTPFAIYKSSYFSVVVEGASHRLLCPCCYGSVLSPVNLCLVNIVNQTTNKYWYCMAIKKNINNRLSTNDFVQNHKWSVYYGTNQYFILRTRNITDFATNKIPISNYFETSAWTDDQTRH